MEATRLRLYQHVNQEIRLRTGVDHNTPEKYGLFSIVRFGGYGHEISKEERCSFMD